MIDLMKNYKIFEEKIWPMIEPYADKKKVFDALKKSGFFRAPASTKYHLNCEGGLCEHSLNVTRELLRLTDHMKLNWQRAASPYIIGFFHDLCKADQYILVGDHYETNKSTILLGHGRRSVQLLSEIMDLTDEEKACIEFHMGAFTDKAEWNKYTGAIHKFPNVLWTHTADMVASHIVELD